MADHSAAPIHPNARCDLARALSLVGMAVHRAGQQQVAIVGAAAGAEATAGEPAASRIEVLTPSPAALAVALLAQGWRPIDGQLGTQLSHPATGLALILYAPATSGSTDQPAVLVDAGGGHPVACWRA